MTTTSADDFQDDEDFNQVEGLSPDFRSELAARLAELAPEVVADGKVDVPKLVELLGDDAVDVTERFGLFWPGKRRALKAAQEPTSATLVPDVESSKEWDTTKNVFIEGDNLEVLKVLQRHYHNKVKMIYIDPPYNTGKDFVYPDNFKEGLDTYLEWTRQVNDEGKKVSTNSETEGRYHSNWLNMMYPRLKLARNLLTDDGVIFISIDDNEAPNLMKLCDEVFGETNYLNTFVWKKGGTGKNDSRFAVVEHEYVLAVAKDARNAAFNFDSQGTVSTSYNHEDADGRYSLVRLDMQNLQYSPALDYDLVGPDGRIYRLSHKNPERPNAIWRWSADRVAREIKELVFRDGHVYTKNYEKAGAKSRTLLTDERFGVTRTGGADLSRIFEGHSYFDFPKPIRLMKFMLDIATNSADVVLDFFAGSSSTAHAVMALNAEDGGSRRFVMVQLPEPTPEGSEARKAGFATIADISRERIRRAGAAIAAEQASQLESRETPLDVGFRAYKLADSNFTKWHVSSDVEPGKLGEHLLELRDSAADDATPEMLLTELLLKLGMSLTEDVEVVDVDGLRVFSVGGGALMAYLDEHVKPTLDQLKAVIATGPAKLIVLEDALKGNDELKTNLAQHCKTHNIELWSA
jgi:adenine-specific DNA-methyltransferase